MKIKIFLLASLFAFQAYAQLPSTQLYLAPIFAGKIDANKWEALTEAKGYHSQAKFLSSSKALLFSGQLSTQVEVFKYDISSKKTTRISESSGSEFSPTPIENDRRFSTVLLATDSSQHLYIYDINGKNCQKIISEQDSIGYHCWLRKNALVFFKLGTSFTLWLQQNYKQGNALLIADSIGRSMHYISREQALYFTKHVGEKQYVINRYQENSGKITKQCALPTGTEDFAIFNKTWFVCCAEGKIWRKNIKENKTWELWSNLPSGLSANRVAISPDGRWICVVVVPHSS